MKKNYTKIILLFIILIIPFLVRLIKIDQIPPSLNWDEVSHTYNAYSILKTGKDQWGIVLPGIFRVYGDYKLPLYIYLTVPSVALLGLTPLSTRLVSILSGTLLTYLVFLIFKEILKKQKSPLKQYFPYLAVLSVGLSSWSVFLSRIAVEANLFLLLFSVSLYFLLKDKPTFKNLSFSTLFFALSLHTYNSSRVLLPFYLLLALLYFKKLPKTHRLPFKNLLGPIVLFLSIFLFAYQTFLTDTGQARYQWVTLLDQGAINRINESRNASDLNPFFARLAHNKLTYFVPEATKNYFSHFNPRFLFSGGGDHYQFSLPDFWLINPILAPFFLIGLFYLLKQLRTRKSKSLTFIILITWLLAAPLPSAITRDAPHVLRSIALFPVIEIISFLGLYQATLFFKNKKSKIVSALPLSIALSTIVTFACFVKMYSLYRLNYDWVWQSGYKEAVEYIKENYDQYDQIWITKKYGEPHEFILFHWPWDPSSYQNDPQKVWDYHANWYWVDAFDKFRFINDWEMKDKITSENPQNTLLVTSPGNYTGGELQKTIFSPNSSLVFEIIKYP